MIIQKENKILRERAKKIESITAAETRNLIQKMAEAMFNEPDGIGIAAPQIGESVQIFLVAKDLLSLETQQEPSEKNQKQRKLEYFTFINPSIKKISRRKENEIEGCLSVRGIYGEVARSEKLIVEYFDETGAHKQRGASGLLARVIQHEMDHLNGILFIDKANNLQVIADILHKKAI